ALPDLRRELRCILLIEVVERLDRFVTSALAVAIKSLEKAASDDLVGFIPRGGHPRGLKAAKHLFEPSECLDTFYASRLRLRFRQRTNEQRIWRDLHRLCQRVD